jgi:L-fuculose-phosphate aldolase
MDRQLITREIVDVCRRLAAAALVAATDGNVSGRTDEGTVLITRSGVAKGDVTEEDLLELDPGGRSLAGRGKPSTESGMHLFVYRERPDVRAVVHAHPPYATGFSTARIPLDRCLLPEVIVGLGTVPLAPYATPSTPEVAASLAPYVRDHDAVLLANHGAVAWGRSPLEAFHRIQKVEHAAHVTFVATLLGGPHALTGEELERLRSVSTASYGRTLPGRPCRPDTSPT